MPLVYVLQDGDRNLYKIGWTRGPLHRRLQAHSTSNPDLKEVHIIETKCAARCETHLKQTLLSRKLIKTLSQEFYELERAEVDTAVEDAREFIREYVANQEELQRLLKMKSNGKILPPEPSALNTYRALLKVREEEYKIKLERTRLENELKFAVGEFDGLDGIVTWRTQPQNYFDEARFKLERPDEYKVYLEVREIRRFLLNDPSHTHEQ